MAKRNYRARMLFKTILPEKLIADMHEMRSGTLYELDRFGELRPIKQRVKKKRAGKK